MTTPFKTSEVARLISDRVDALAHRKTQNEIAAEAGFAKTGPYGGVSIRGLFALWERDHLAEGKAARTVGDFRQKIEALIDYLGHDDAQSVTPENIAEWADHLRHEGDKTLSARTVSQKYLAAAKLVFGTGVAKKKLQVNPAAEVSVRFKKPQRTRPKGYTDDEARTILTAALCDPALLGKRSEDNKRAIR